MKKQSLSTNESSIITALRNAQPSVMREDEHEALFSLRVSEREAKFRISGDGVRGRGANWNFNG